MTPATVPYRSSGDVDRRDPDVAKEWLTARALKSEKEAAIVCG